MNSKYKRAFLNGLILAAFAILAQAVVLLPAPYGSLVNAGLVAFAIFIQIVQQDQQALVQADTVKVENVNVETQPKQGQPQVQVQPPALPQPIRPPGSGYR